MSHFSSFRPTNRAARRSASASRRFIAGTACVAAAAAGIAITSTAADAAAVTTNALDTFQRSVTSGFGVANQGGSWSVQTASYLSVPTDHGHVAALPAGVTDSGYIRNVSAADELARLNFSLPQLPSFANGQQVMVRTRVQSTGTSIAAQAQVANDGTVTLTLLEQTAASSFTPVSNPVALPTKLTAGQSWSLDLQTTGTAPVAVLARAFPAGGTVPDFQVANNVSDSTVVSVAGAVGFADTTPVSTIGVPVDLQGYSAWPVKTPTPVSTTWTPAPTPTGTTTPPAPTGTTVAVDPNTVVGQWTNNEAGLSFEYKDLVSGNLMPTPELINLMKNLGPGILRIGGNTLDAGPTTGPTAPQISGLNSLLNQTGWKVLYSVDLAYFNAAAQGAEVNAVYAALGSNVLAFACGNEPNVYVQHGYKSSYTVSQYLSDVTTCLNTVRANAPGATLAGPDTSNGGWVPDFLSTKPANLGLLDQHLYPFNACTSPNTAATDLLSASTATSEASTVASEAQQASSAGIPLRLSEDNSIGCGGINGVSDTFAASLWASDFPLIAAENGSTGYEMHQNGTDVTCNTFSAVCRPGGGVFTAQEPYYGMLMTRQLGVGSLLATTGAGGANVAVHAVKHSDGTISVLLVNRSNTDYSASVLVPAGLSHAGTVALTAPGGTSATSGITIGGQAVNTDGSFNAPVAQSAAVSNGAVAITVPAYSGLMITLS